MSVLVYPSAYDQPPPPSLRDILAAYKANGDGDREMLLSMLNAKAAEDQRIASVAALHRTALEIYQTTLVDGSHQPLNSINGHAYMPPLPSLHQSEQDDFRRQHSHHRVTSRSRSPPKSHVHIPPIRDAPPPENAASHSRKRLRMSQPSSSHVTLHEQLDHLPPSPYSSSSRSDSADYSPRSRASMAIGSLLSSGPKHTAADVHDQD
ncbi:hypothetical protein AX14_007800 [Amanita brunnescens Koide BX004]|nr:hypothetical protein AX14_007800 [Amanita brunnescens Koide BX004]